MVWQAAGTKYESSTDKKRIFVCVLGTCSYTDQMLNNQLKEINNKLIQTTMTKDVHNVEILTVYLRGIHTPQL